MAENDEMIQGSDARVYVTNPDYPEEGGTFVWAKARWYEREEGESGAVAFPPIADSFSDLLDMVNQDSGADLTELDDEYARDVRDEFMEQDILYPYAQDSERVDTVPLAKELREERPDIRSAIDEIAPNGPRAGSFEDEVLDRIEPEKDIRQRSRAERRGGEL